jgi:hypothetical protein
MKNYAVKRKDGMWAMSPVCPCEYWGSINDAYTHYLSESQIQQFELSDGEILVEVKVIRTVEEV